MHSPQFLAAHGFTPYLLSCFSRLNKWKKDLRLLPLYLFTFRFVRQNYWTSISFPEPIWPDCPSPYRSRLFAPDPLYIWPELLNQKSRGNSRFNSTLNLWLMEPLNKVKLFALNLHLLSPVTNKERRNLKPEPIWPSLLNLKVLKVWTLLSMNDPFQSSKFIQS